MHTGTAKALEQAGWTSERRVSTAEAERLLRDDGYVVSDPVRQFLASFEGIRLTFPRAGGDEGDIAFDVALAISGIYRERVETYQERTGKALVPVGEVFRRHMVLMLADDGSMYGGYDDLLVEFGPSAEAALDTIIAGNAPRKLP